MLLGQYTSNEQMNALETKLGRECRLGKTKRYLESFSIQVCIVCICYLAFYSSCKLDLTNQNMLRDDFCALSLLTDVYVWWIEAYEHSVLYKALL